MFFHLQDKYGNEVVEQLDDSQVVNFNGLSSRDVVTIRRVSEPENPRYSERDGSITSGERPLIRQYDDVEEAQEESHRG